MDNLDERGCVQDGKSHREGSVWEKVDDRSKNCEKCRCSCGGRNSCVVFCDPCTGSKAVIVGIAAEDEHQLGDGGGDQIHGEVKVDQVPFDLHKLLYGFSKAEDKVGTEGGNDIPEIKEEDMKGEETLNKEIISKHQIVLILPVGKRKYFISASPPNSGNNLYDILLRKWKSGGKPH